MPVLVWSLDRFGVGFSYVNLEHTLSLDAIECELDGLWRLTVHLSRLVDHIHLLIAAHTGYGAIVLNADEQVPTTVVGKCRDAASNLAGIADLILEVLMLVLALGDE